MSTEDATARLLSPRQNVFRLLQELPNVHVLRENQQTRIIQTAIRNKDTNNEDFIFFTDRLSRLLMEEALSFLSYTRKDVITPTGSRYEGLEPAAKICGVSIMRAGESMERALRDTCRGARIGKILIQRNESDPNKAPCDQYNYCKLPADIEHRFVILMDPMLATGGSAIRATKALVEQYKVAQERIVFVNVVSCPEGLTAYSQAFPKVRIVTASIDDALNEHKYIVPGLGDFGDRYFGTDI
eukprot:PhF_6_TR42143/c0_g1_i1/m.63673/K00761/upp, UPRT; uracil phosphoribosyltransferase